MVSCAGSPTTTIIATSTNRLIRPSPSRAKVRTSARRLTQLFVRPPCPCPYPARGEGTWLTLDSHVREHTLALRRRAAHALSQARALTGRSDTRGPRSHSSPAARLQRLRADDGRRGAAQCARVRVALAARRTARTGRRLAHYGQGSSAVEGLSDPARIPHDRSESTLGGRQRVGRAHARTRCDFSGQDDDTGIRLEGRDR